MRMLLVGLLGMSVTAGAQTHPREKYLLPPVRVGASAAIGAGQPGAAGEIGIYGEATHFWLRPGLEVRGHSTGGGQILGTLVGPRVEHCVFGGCFYAGAMFGPNHAEAVRDTQGIASQFVGGIEILPPEHPNFGWKLEFDQTVYSQELPQSSSTEVLIGFVVRFP